MITVERIKHYTPEELLRLIFEKLCRGFNKNDLKNEDFEVYQLLNSGDDEVIYSILNSIASLELSFPINYEKRGFIKNKFYKQKRSFEYGTYSESVYRSIGKTVVSYLIKILEGFLDEESNFNSKGTFIETVLNCLQDLHLKSVHELPITFDDDISNDDMLMLYDKRLKSIFDLRIKLFSKIRQPNYDRLSRISGVVLNKKEGSKQIEYATLFKVQLNSYLLVYSVKEIDEFYDKFEEIISFRKAKFKKRLKERFVNYTFNISAEEELLKEDYPNEIAKGEHKVLIFKSLKKHYNQSEYSKILFFLNGELEEGEMINTDINLTKALAVLKWLLNHKDGSKLSVNSFELQDTLIKHFQHKRRLVNKTTITRAVSDSKVKIDENIENEIIEMADKLSIK